MLTVSASAILVLLVVSIAFAVSANVTPLSGSTGFSATDSLTGVTFTVRVHPLSVSVKKAMSFDSWWYITNPSKDISRTSTTFVNIFGDQITAPIPLNVVTLQSMSVSVTNSSGTFVALPSCSPPTGATTAGQFPSPGSCFFAYRVDFRSWGSVVNPDERAMVYFVGFAGFTAGSIGAQTYTDSITYTFGGLTRTLSVSYIIQVNA